MIEPRSPPTQSEETMSAASLWVIRPMGLSSVWKLTRFGDIQPLEMPYVRLCRFTVSAANIWFFISQSLTHWHWTRKHARVWVDL